MLGWDVVVLPVGWAGWLLRVGASLPSFSSILPDRWCSGHTGDPGTRLPVPKFLRATLERCVCVWTQGACQRVFVILLLMLLLLLCVLECVCERDTRTATYRSLLVFAFQKAATVSVVVQWVKFVWIQGCSKAQHAWKKKTKKLKVGCFFFSSPNQDFITKQVSEWYQIMRDIRVWVRRDHD